MTLTKQHITCQDIRQLTYFVFSSYWKSDGQFLGIFTYENKRAITFPIWELDAILLLGLAVYNVHIPEEAAGGVL
jgi:hypothetical protein